MVVLDTLFLEFRRVRSELIGMMTRHREFGPTPPNTSVEPTAYAVSFRIVMDSLVTLMSVHSSAHRLWLTSIR